VFLSVVKLCGNVSFANNRTEPQLEHSHDVKELLVQCIPLFTVQCVVVNAQHIFELAKDRKYKYKTTTTKHFLLSFSKNATSG
jgi:hypothetical protein